ncbi:MAG: poly-beta-1,6-N-acetyl-D-glucosamine biosynthesis protein PgaD [Nitrospirae bacterium]|nr:poly-beta-1,6-N-acetyl-D-glucosamine biosynthesis protein PgaD [Nitrospirota bacterium]
MPKIEIRDRPEFKSFLRNMAELGITAIVWGIWVYLFLPVIDIILWIFGARQFYIEVIQKVGYKEFLALTNRMGLIVLIVFIVMRSWGYYNYLRFGRGNMRKSLPPLHIEHLTEFFRISRDRLSEIKSKKEVILSSGETIEDIDGWLINKRDKSR